MTSRIPPLLQPYLSQPDDGSLIILTSVLGASANWLVLRFLYSFLKEASGSSRNDDIVENSDGDATGVVLVSFLRDKAFWKDGATRLSIDIDGLERKGQFVFVDGLTGLYPFDNSSYGKDSHILQSSNPNDMRDVITQAIASLKTSRKVLIVDQLDLVLAASGDDVTVPALQNMLLSLREHVQATVLTLSADDPLLQSQATTLEREHAAFVLSQAHEADSILALRLLDTGTAKDVSGVVRITCQGKDDGEDDASAGKEYLYYVAGDGTARVFERGS